jgi:cytochrome oxidase assembly protein ShyY1
VSSPEPTWSPASVTITALVVVVACVLLGRWQLGRVYRPVDGYSAEPASVPIGRLVPEHEAVGAADVARQVTVTGVYDRTAQRTVPGHVLDGQPVYWVVTTLTLPDSSRLPVVRGWVTAPGQSLEAPPAGQVTVTARLERGAVSAAGSNAYLSSGYLVRTAQSPPDPLSLQPVPVPPPANQAPDEFHLQNAIYVTQWWLLAAIMVGFWWRLVRPGRGQTAGLEPVGSRD